MPTNDERREVAARLREYAYLDHTSLPWYLQKAVHGDFSHIDEPSDGETFAKLADLIEPEPERTCRVVEGKCDVCGFEPVIFTSKYCPECGARVKKETE